MRRATPFLPRYRLTFKLRALAALDTNDGRVYQTARQLRIPRSTLWDWNRDREKIHREVERLREQRGVTLEEQLETVIDEIAGAMLNKVENAKLLESTRVLKLILDLSREIAAQRAAEEAEREDVYVKLERLFERYRQTNEAEGEVASFGGGSPPNESMRL